MTLQEGRPQNCGERLAKEVRVYDFLDSLGISYRRVDHEAAMTMEVCAEIDRVLEAPTCKNLFLANRQQTVFYLLMMPGDKPFRTKDLSAQIGSSRLSFGSPEHMQALLGVEPGSASVLGLLHDTQRRVQLLVDEALLQAPRLGCHPCRNTSTLSIATSDVFERLLPHLGVTPITVSLPDDPE